MYASSRFDYKPMPAKGRFSRYVPGYMFRKPEPLKSCAEDESSWMKDELFAKWNKVQLGPRKSLFPIGRG